LVVSTGPPVETVPTVVDLTEQQATEALNAAGFDVAVVEQEVDDPDLVGVVISQDPAGDEVVPQGTTVTIVVGVEPP
jgi:serine/threonine-protein kinase